MSVKDAIAPTLNASLKPAALKKGLVPARGDGRMVVES
jgi:hypothetical protein